MTSRQQLRPCSTWGCSLADPLPSCSGQYTACSGRPEPERRFSALLLPDSLPDTVPGTNLLNNAGSWRCCPALATVPGSPCSAGQGQQLYTCLNLKHNVTLGPNAAATEVARTPKRLTAETGDGENTGKLKVAAARFTLCCCCGDVSVRRGGGDGAGAQCGGGGGTQWPNAAATVVATEELEVGRRE